MHCAARAHRVAIPHGRGDRFVFGQRTAKNARYRVGQCLRERQQLAHRLRHALEHAVARGAHTVGIDSTTGAAWIVWAEAAGDFVQSFKIQP